MFKVRGLKKNSSNISNSIHQTKNEPSVLMLKDVFGNTYKYIYPNDMDQFSKMSTLGNKNSSTMIHLPPGILKSDNTSSETGVSPVDHPYKMISSTTSERPRTNKPKNTTNQHKQSLPGSKDNHILSSTYLMPKRELNKVNNTAVSINSNISNETTTIKDCITEKDEDGNSTNYETITTPIINNYSNNISNNAPILSEINNKQYDTSENLYKSCDTCNGLILLVKNDIKLKLFLNSNGILDKSSIMNSKKNSTIKDELSTEDNDVEKDDELEFPTSLSIVE